MTFSIPARWISLIAGATILLATGCGPDRDDRVVQTDIPFRTDGTLDVIRPDGSIVTTLAIEIAEGDSARARGLMQRRSLPAKGGMLFLSNESKVQTFWMKNTPLPLDIIFIGADSSIVSIAERTLPFSERTIESTGPAQYVLEVRAGYAARFGIDSTATVRWRRTSAK
ncbi:MAG: DUF192 domain-containing protein [Rhodothermales bacterium]